MTDFWISRMVLPGASVFDWLLGLRELRVSQDGLSLGWRYELPAWAWVLIILAAGGASWWSYSRMLGPAWGRAVLAGVRTTLLMVLVVVLVGPVLVWNREDVDPDYLIMLVDRSGSMNVKDAGDGEAQVSRDASLWRAVGSDPALFGPERLGRDRRLLWLGFDERVYPMNPPETAPQTMPSPGDRSTAIRTSIEQALGYVSGHPVSGIVLFSDGRSPQDTGAELVHRLQQQAVSVFPVPLGATVPTVDLSLARMDAPEKAFVDDTVPVTVWIDRQPRDAAIDVRSVRVRLIDRQTGRVMDEQSPKESSPDQPVRLVGRSSAVGVASWGVELVYAPPAGSAVQPELITDNNSREARVELIDRPIRVLYVEGYPRWEYRYLQGLLVRERSVDCSVMLVSADQDFPQEGDVPITRLPQNAQRWAPFDVVIVGDVPSGYFTLEQQTALRDHVATSGAGLLWIGGAHHTPYSYETSPLADLLPMRRPAMTQPVGWESSVVAVAPTPLATSLGLFADAPTHEADPAPAGDLSWLASMPGLMWVQQAGALKPSVDVLATASIGNGSSVPLVSRLRYGAGQVIYVATDDTWRWRYGRGDFYFQQFWLQLIRMLGRQRVQQNDQPVRLTVSHPSVELGRSVVVELSLEDSMRRDQTLPRVAVCVSRAGGAGDDPAGQNVETIELLPGDDPSEATVRAAGSSGRPVYRAIWKPAVAGRMTLKVVEPGLAGLDVSAPLEVIHPADEMRHPLPDHDRLADLARQTGGKVVGLDRLEDLVSLVPNRARRTPNDLREPLWDSPLSLMVVVLLLAAEWVGRKLVQLA